MEITQSLLHDQIEQVFNNRQSKTNFSWSGVIHFNDKEVYNIIRITGLTISRNYVNNFTDEITFRALIPLGKYARKIYPNRNNLQVTLTKTFLNESVADENIENNNILTERYSAVLLNQDRSPTEIQGKESNDEDSLDLSAVVEVDFQLISKPIELIRTIQIGGVYTNVKVDELLKSLLTNEASKIKTDDDKSILGASILDGFNKEVKKQIVVPHGTSLIDLAGYLQSKIGFYSSGIGSYIQDRYWYNYYLYDTTKYEQRKDTVTFIVLPQNKYPNVERTYLVKNGSTTILVTGDTSFTDDNNTNYLNKGNGARFTNANKLMSSTVKTEDNKAVMSRGKLNTEIVVDKRKDIPNYSPTTDTKITSNSFSTLTDINKRNGAMFQCVWQSADFDILTPGMATKILFDDSGEIKEYYGVIHRIDYISVAIGGITGDRYSNQAVINAFVRKQTN